MTLIPYDRRKKKNSSARRFKRFIFIIWKFQIIFRFYSQNRTLIMNGWRVCMCEKNWSLKTAKMGKKCCWVMVLFLCVSTKYSRKKRLSLHNEFEIKTQSFNMDCIQLKFVARERHKNMDFNWFSIPEIIVLNIALTIL